MNKKESKYIYKKVLHQLYFILPIPHTNMVPTKEKIREEIKRSKITKRLRTRAQKAAIQKPGKGERIWRVLLPTNCLSVFGNSAGLAIKRFKVWG